MRTIEWTNNRIGTCSLFATFNQMRFIIFLRHIVTPIVCALYVCGRLMMFFFSRISLALIVTHAQQAAVVWLGAFQTLKRTIWRWNYALLPEKHPENPAHQPQLLWWQRYCSRNKNEPITVLYYSKLRNVCRCEAMHSHQFAQHIHWFVYFASVIIFSLQTQ